MTSQSPVSDSLAMLAGMQPVLRKGYYRFVPHGPDEDFTDLIHRMFAMVREDEGMTLIIRGRESDPGPHFACITLQVHSALEGVGLTASVATALAEAGMPCNVVAAYYHDHLFVPWERGEEAIAILKKVSADARR
ncbi:MAG: ACT domain-containing protein [Pseudomonadota bacterium]